jgi:hypothetical protein
MNIAKRKIVFGAALVLLLAGSVWFAVKKFDDAQKSSADSRHGALTSKNDSSTNTAPSSPRSTSNTSLGSASTHSAVGLIPEEAYKLFKGAITARGALNAIQASSTISNSDKLYYSAMLGELCSDPGLEKVRATPPAPTVTTPIIANDPTMSPQQQAARKLNERRKLRNYCESMPVLSAEAQRAAWLEAANSGDLKSKARLDWATFEATFRPDPAVPAGGPLTVSETLSPPAWDTTTLNSMVQGLSTRDPSAIVNIGHMLEHSGHTNFIALSATGQSLSDLPISTWALIACEYGAQCGAENPTVLVACANQGRCDVATMEDYYRRYVWTGEDAARYDALVPYLRDLINKGDRSLLTITPFDPTKIPRRFYGKPPRPYKPS